MEATQEGKPLLEPAEEKTEGDGGDKADETEKMMPMPFGKLGISFLIALLQYTLYFGLAMLLLMLFHSFGSK